MAEQFACPACGAPLNYDGSGYASMRCPFCNNSVVVPEALRSRRPDAPPPPAAPPSEPPISAASPLPTAVRGSATAVGAGYTLGCLALAVVAVVAYILALAYLPLRQSGSYAQAVKATQTNPDVVRAMGAPIEVDWWQAPTGGIRHYSDGSCSADYHISIHGSRKSGELWVLSKSTGSTFFNDGTWTPKYVVTVYNSDVRPIWVGR